jgi:hypothetical protein
VKLINCKANIYFNRQCLDRRIIPKYANFKIPHTSPAATNTRRKLQVQRIKDEIQFLYKKKQHLNCELYQAHPKATQEWNGTWHLISSHIDTAVNTEATRKYTTIKNKLVKLTHQQTKTVESNTCFYPRVINSTSIQFTIDELALLEKGLKYNLQCKHNKWLQTLALEAETAICCMVIPACIVLLFYCIHLIELYRQMVISYMCNCRV